VKCWGNGENGELGNDDNMESYIPVEVSGITNATSISLGGSHSCALVEDGKVLCWGSNGIGQLGSQSFDEYGDLIEYSEAPIEVLNITTATSIALGSTHSCALLANSTVMCWGSNEYGQLGDGTTTDSFTPVSVPGITNVTSIALGYFHSCAVLIDATVVCWGWNNRGQLGDGTTTDRNTPVEVVVVINPTSIAMGRGHSCVFLTDGKMMCWGENINGQLGDGTTTQRSTPVEVSGLYPSPPNATYVPPPPSPPNSFVFLADSESSAGRVSALTALVVSLLSL
jgi:alpha-tubulin suppressor-like RCC1 family protein